MSQGRDEFGVRVEELRRRLHLTQEAMVETVNVSIATVNRLQNGRTAPSKLALRQIDLLCKAHHFAPVIHTIPIPQDAVHGALTVWEPVEKVLGR